MKIGVLRGLGLLAALIAVLAVAALCYRTWRQHENTVAFAIHTPRGIDEGAFIRIGGVDQWIRIRGEDHANPVLLIVHGGPGLAMSPLTGVFQPWERYFTVVQWDQRGAGKTFARNGAGGGMTIARMTEDGLAVTQNLRAHLHADRIVVLGHSWGTILALRMVKQRPDLFSAYVGTGQLVDKRQNEIAGYAMLMGKMRARRGADGIAALAKLGPPPYADIANLYAERKLQSAYDTPAERGLAAALTPDVLFAPDYSLWDVYAYQQGADFAQSATYAEVNAYDARALGLKFAVPVFIFEGDADSMTPAALARRYFDALQAPRKEFALLPGGGHAAMLTMPGEFLAELVARVRPVALGNATLNKKRGN